MGRTKGALNKKTLAKQESLVVDVVKEPIIDKPKKELKPVCQCEICGENIYSSPYIANFNSITGIAHWWRHEMPQRLKLCEKCAHSLSDAMEQWYIKNKKEIS